jgi:hypothetical protein
MFDDAGLGIAFGLFAILAAGFYHTTLNFVFVLESHSFGLALLLDHLCGRGVDDDEEEEEAIAMEAGGDGVMVEECEVYLFSCSWSLCLVAGGGGARRSGTRK